MNRSWLTYFWQQYEIEHPAVPIDRAQPEEATTKNAAARINPGILLIAAPVSETDRQLKLIF